MGEREGEEQKEGGRERDARRGKESVYKREPALSHLQLTIIVSLKTNIV